MTSLDTGIASIRSALQRLVDAWHWYCEIPAVARIHGWLAQIRDGWRRLTPRAQQRDAQGPLRPRAADHHSADGDPAVGARLRVHGAALERGHPAPFRRRGRRHRRADRRLQGLSAGRRPRADPPHRAGAARPGGRFPAARRPAAAGAEAVLLAARPDAVGGVAQADRPAVLDRHRRQIGAGRNPRPARQHGDARVRAAQRRLCLEFGNLPALDGRHLDGAAHRRHHFPAQPDQADPAPGRRRRKLRQGPRGAEFPPARRARGAARGGRLHRDEDARRARHRAAHRHARRRLATTCAPCSPASSWSWR